MNDLEKVVNEAIKLDEPLGLFIEMPGFEKPELIINPVENLEKKLKYWKSAYDSDLEHKYAEGVKIIDWVYC